ncbi:DNA polymerase III subunit alpha [bacterium]|nr:DNA polymerase III subunit alpha [bacterium]
MDKPYISLHNHTEFSLLDGACRINKLVKLAAEYGMDAIAITDHGSLFGVIPFYNAALDAGIKPIIGEEAYIAPGDMHEKKPSSEGPNSGYHLVLLVKNQTGYKNLLKISSAGYTEGFYYKPRVDKDFLSAHSEGLIASTACLKGEIPYRLLRDDFDGAKKTLGEFCDIFGKENVYVELMDHDIPEEKIVLPRLVGLAKEFGIPTIATNDAHYLRPEDYEFHDLLLCLQTGKFVDDTNRMRFSTNRMFFHSPTEMASVFADYPEALANTREVADRCFFELSPYQAYLPKFPIPEGYTDIWDYVKRRTDEGIIRLYGEVTETISKRVEYELDTIRKMGFLGYFAIVSDFTDAARERGIRVGPGRGSGASSIVAYAMGITNIDPLRYGLLFERFLNPERVSLPDFDIDFEDKYRERVIDYVREKYGNDSVCQIITFNFMKARSAIKDVGRVLRMPYDEVDSVSKLVPQTTTIPEALEQIQDFKHKYESNPDVKKLVDYAIKLEGLPRHAGKHAAGVVITPGPLTDFVPLFRTNKDEIITQYDWVSVEKIGVVKMDFLGLKTLSIISETERMIAKNRNEVVNAEKIPLGDKETFEMISHGDTLGVFQFESEGMTRYLRKLHPDRIEDMIAMNALYRPGPMDFIDEYIKRKHGKAVEYPHKTLEPILKETFGIIVYQEQVMQIARELAGFSFGQADILRRAMGKKKLDVMMAMREEFIKGAENKKIDKAIAKKVFDMMGEFARYGFNKSHSAAYSVVAYQTAYLKAHYRNEFTAANMTNEIDNHDKLYQLIENARHHDIEVFIVDVNRSLPEFVVENDKILYGIAAVRNVGFGAANAIVEAREKDGLFENLFDFCERIDLRLLNRRALESLVCAGAFDSLIDNRAELMASIPEALSWAAKAKNSDIAASAGDLFASDDTLKKFPEPIHAEPWNKKTTLDKEKDALGFFFSGHPLNRFVDEISAFTNITTSELQSKGVGTGVVLIGTLASLEKTITKKKDEMAYGTFEDLTGSASVVFFPDTYRKCSNSLEKDAMFLIRGKYQEDNRGSKILVEDVIPLQNVRNELVNCLHIRLDAGIATEEIEELKTLLNKHVGDKRLKLHIVGNDHTWRATSSELDNTASRELISELREIIGEDNVWISS